MQKTRGLYPHTCSRVLKNREGTINLFHLLDAEASLYSTPVRQLVSQSVSLLVTLSRWWQWLGYRGASASPSPPLRDGLVYSKVKSTLDLKCALVVTPHPTNPGVLGPRTLPNWRPLKLQTSRLTPPLGQVGPHLSPATCLEKYLVHRPQKWCRVDGLVMNGAWCTAPPPRCRGLAPPSPPSCLATRAGPRPPLWTKDLASHLTPDTCHLTPPDTS